MSEKLLNPLPFFKTEGREKHLRNAHAFFDRLVRESNIDPIANQTASEDYEKQLRFCDELISRRLLFALGCVGSMLLATLGIVCLFFWEESPLFIPASLLLLLLGISLLFSSQIPRFRSAREQLAEARELAQQLRERAAEQIAPLNQQFTPRDALTLIEQTVPGFIFLERFTTAHRALLNNCDFQEHTDDSSSVLNTLAGTYNHNAFLFTTRLSCTMVDTTYEGSKTIHWEEQKRQYVPKTRTVTNSYGNQETETYYEWEYVTVEKSETLTAEYTAPKPRFTTQSVLGYGHQAAPDLSFNRKPRHAQKLGEQALKARVRSGEKKLQRKGAHALARNEDFTPMVNETFDVLFGATDRDNSHQFLQLFTPVAQKNLVALLTDDMLCGDEFSFQKSRRFNTIPCSDSLLTSSPLHYHDYSLKKAREAFVSYHSDYFCSLFGCFAPLLSIPAYQEAPLPPQAPSTVANSNFTLYEHESVANALSAELVAHPACTTKTIRKTELLSAAAGEDVVRVHTSGFAARNRTETYHIKGGDGYYHDVDVDWIEYIPKTKTVTISIQAADQSTNTTQDSGAACLHGLIAKIIQTSQEESL